MRCRARAACVFEFWRANLNGNKNNKSLKNSVNGRITVILLEELKIEKNKRKKVVCLCTWTFTEKIIRGESGRIKRGGFEGKGV